MEILAAGDSPDVLILDQDQYMVLALAAFLRRAGRTVECTGDPAALDRDYCHLLVIADCHVGGSDWRTVVRKLGDLKRRCGLVEVLLVTAYASDEVRRLADQNGVDRIIEKPVPVVSLAEGVLEMLEGGQKACEGRRIDGTCPLQMERNRRFSKVS